MRRLLSLATFVLLLSLIPAWTQMRGGGRAGSSGGHGGFGGRGSFGGGPMGGGHFSGGAPSRGGFSGSRFQSRGFSPGNSFHQGFHPSPFLHGDRFRGNRFGGRFGRHRFNNRFAFGNCFGCRRSWGWGWPWGYSGFYDPYWWWDSHRSYDEDRERDLAEARAMNEQSLREQRMLREQDQDLYSQSDPPAQNRVQQAPVAPTPTTVLVFRDQHTEEVQNYAIVGSTLWNFAPQHTRKIPLSDLDVAATVRANDQRGVEFSLPNSGEGQ